jgi:hypothetical protein
MKADQIETWVTPTSREAFWGLESLVDAHSSICKDRYHFYTPNFRIIDSKLQDKMYSELALVASQVLK